MQNSDTAASPRPFFGRSQRLMLAVLVLAAGPALALGRWHSTREPLRALAYAEAHRTVNDSAAYASAIYHASYARQARDARWSFSGYATHATLGGILVLALVVSALPIKRKGD